MKIFENVRSQQLVIWSLVIALSFFQAAPSGIAANAPVVPADQTNAPASEKPVMEAENLEPPPSDRTATTTDFQMNTGGITLGAAEVSETDIAEAASLTSTNEPAEELASDDIQAQIDQLIKESEALEARAAIKLEEAAKLNEQAAQAREKAEALMKKSQAEVTIAQEQMQKGQALLASADKEMADITTREKKVREQLAAYQRMRKTPTVLASIAKLKKELQSLALQKIAVSKKKSQANELFKSAQKHYQSAASAQAAAQKASQSANALSKKAASAYDQAQSMLAEAAEKISEAEALKDKLIPPAVQSFVDQLNQQLSGSGYAVTATTLQADGTYLVSMASTVKQALQGHLGNMAFVLSPEGVVTSISQVTYVDISGVDGQLLFDAMKQLSLQRAEGGDLFYVGPYPLPGPAVTETTESLALVLMTQITVVMADNEAIFYKKNNAYYKAFRNATGQVVIAEKYPVAVGDFLVDQEAMDQVNQLQSEAAQLLVQAQADPAGSAAIVAEAQSLLNQAAALLPPPEDLKFFSEQAAMLQAEAADLLKLAAASPSDADKLKNAAHDMIGVSEMILEFLEKTQVILRENARLVQLASSILASIPQTPPAVQAYADQLQSELGTDYSVRAEQSPDKILPPRYLVSVLYTPKVLREGQLRSMVFKVNEDGTFVSVEGVVFDGVENVDGQLLYEALEGFSNDIRTALEQATANYERSAALAEQASEAANEASERFTMEQERAQDDEEKYEYFVNRAEKEENEINKKQACISSRTGNECRQYGYTDQNGPASAALKQLLTAQIAQHQKNMADYFDRASSAARDASNHFKAAQKYAMQAEQYNQQAAAYALEAQKYFQQAINYQKKLLTVTLVEMTRVTISKAEDGVLFFVRDGKHYKAYRDPDGNVQVEEIVVVTLPADVLQAAQSNLPADQLEQLNAAMLDVGPNTQYTYQESTDGKTKSWTWTSADGVTTYALNQYRIRVPAGIPDASGNQQFQEEIRWSFAMETPVTADEVRAAAAELSGDQTAVVNAAIDQAIAGGVTEFFKTVSGNDVSYRWKNPAELDRTYSMTIGPNGEVYYSIQQQTDISNASSDTAVIVNVNQGFDSLQAAVSAAQSGTTITVTGEGTISGENLVIPEGVTLNVPDDQTHLELGTVQIGAPVPGDPLQGQAGGVISSVSTLISLNEGTISGGSMAVIPATTSELQITGEGVLPSQAIVEDRLDKAALLMNKLAATMKGAGVSREEQKEVWKSVDEEMSVASTIVREAAQAARSESRGKAQTISRAWKNFQKELARARTQDRQAGNNESSTATFEKGSLLLKNLIEELTK